MRKIIWMMSVSVDGYMEGPNREIDWHMVDDELHRHMNGWIGRRRRFPRGAGHLRADGRVLADRRPGPGRHTDDRRVRADLAGHAEGRLLAHPGTALAGTRLSLHDVVPAEVLALKAQPGGDLVLGGADLGAEFARHDLIDEYRLYVHPVVIGRGKQALHPSDAKVPLQLVETHTFGNGVVMLRYERRPSGLAVG